MSLSTGERLGRYEILGPLGRGGMGTVYRARDTVLGREVAVKVLAEHLTGSPEQRERFEREAQAVAALSHPAILAIHDFGTVGGTAYAVTELLEGRTLGDAVDAGPLAWPEALRIAIEIADGLAAAHAKGIVHRDLKPQNVFLTDGGRVKVLDFGLATRAGGDGGDVGAAAPRRLTEEGMIVGTPGYMAPEQLSGEPTDARCDIFAMGCLLHEMLTGRRAFAQNSVAEIFVAILRDDPPPPSSLVADIPAALDEVTKRCLQKDPSGRFASGHELLASLRALTSSVASTRIDLTSRPPSKARRPRTAISLAVLPFLNVGGDPATEYLAEGIADELIHELSRWRRLKVMARSTVFRFRGEADALKVGRDLGVTAVLSGRLEQLGETVVVGVELMDTGQGWLIWGDRYRRPLTEVLAIESDIIRQVGDALKVSVSTPQRRRLTHRHKVDQEAHLLYLKARYQWGKGTVESLRKSVELYESALERDPLYADALAGVAQSLALLGSDRYGAMPLSVALPRVRAAAARALEIDGTSAEAHVALGFAGILAWDWADAHRELRAALALEPANTNAHYYLAIWLTMTGDFEAAIDLRHRFLELDPLSLIGNADFGVTYLSARRYPEAILQCTRTLDIEPAFSQAMFWLGFSQCHAGKADDAVKTFERAVEVTRGAAQMRGGLAYALAFAGRKEEAETAWLALRAEAAERHVPLVALVLPAIALGKTEEAFSFLEKAVEARASFLIGARVYPMFDLIRGDPRFDELLVRVGLGLGGPAAPNG